MTEAQEVALAIIESVRQKVKTGNEMTQSINLYGGHYLGDVWSDEAILNVLDMLEEMVNGGEE